MSHNRPQILLLTLCALFGVAACSSEAKFCDKMKQLYGDEMNDCETDALPEIKQQCKDPNAVIDCMVGAADKAAADKCFETKCEKK